MATVSDRKRNMENAQPKFVFRFPFLHDRATVEYFKRSETKVMLILRGLPGSGKSTLAREIQQCFQCRIHSADSFFTSQDGRYYWDPKLIGRAHDSCKQQVSYACSRHQNLILIDNTNIKLEEFKLYLEIAILHSYVVLLVEPNTPWRYIPKQLAQKNIHDIQLPTIIRKMEEWEIVAPDFFGWFLNKTDSDNFLNQLAREILSIMDAISLFRSTFPTYRTLENYFNLTGKHNSILHCISNFCLNSVQRALDYSRQPEVAKAVGAVFTLHIIGFVVTPRTFTARVRLTKSQLELWNQDDFVPLNRTEVTLSMPALSETLTKMSLNSTHKGVTRRNRSGKSVKDYWWQPVTGAGARAHIPLGRSNRISSVQPGLDVLDVVKCETQCDNIGEMAVIPTYKGRCCFYGRSRWAMYLDEEIMLKALFAGSYNSR